MLTGSVGAVMAAPGLPRNSGGPDRVGSGMSVQKTELGLDGPVGGHLATP
ncbi:MAG: hypothetical protein QOD82_4425, partial [Pseudonocardiales bacterium]|nr:hypothetical protein [Pseudonocardiales bacterium]